MHRLRLNQVQLWTCVTRGKSPKSEPASLFVKRTPFSCLQTGGYEECWSGIWGGEGRRGKEVSFRSALRCARRGRVSWLSVSKPWLRLLSPNCLIYRSTKFHGYTEGRTQTPSKGLGVCEQFGTTCVGAAAGDNSCTTWPPPQRQAQTRRLEAGSGPAREAS